MKVRWLPTPPRVDESTLVVVVEAILPVFLWPLMVRQEVEEKLATVERFLVEASLRLGDITTEDVDEMTGLPVEATLRLAERLCLTGVFEAAGDGRFTVVEDAARAALDRAAVVTYRTRPLTIVLLPGTGEALAFEHRGRRRAPALDRLAPVGRTPVSEELRGRPLHELVGELVESGRVVGLPEGVVGVVEADDEQAVPDTCPAYRAVCQVRQAQGGPSDGVEALADLYGDRDDHREHLDLSSSPGVIERWRRQGELLSTMPAVRRLAQRAAGIDTEASMTATIERVGPVEWVLSVDAAAARAVVARRGRRLVAPGGFHLEDTDEATATEVTARFEPLDAAAAVVFAIEGAVERIVAEAPHYPTPVPSGLVDAALAASLDHLGLKSEDAALPMAADDVLDRLWEHGDQHLVYRLRASQDFAYA